MNEHQLKAFFSGYMQKDARGQSVAGTKLTGPDTVMKKDNTSTATVRETATLPVPEKTVSTGTPVSSAVNEQVANVVATAPKTNSPVTPPASDSMSKFPLTTTAKPWEPKAVV